MEDEEDEEEEVSEVEVKIEELEEEELVDEEEIEEECKSLIRSFDLLLGRLFVFFVLSQVLD